MPETQQVGPERQTVVFRLGQEFYGIDIGRVQEIIRLQPITPIPRTEPHVRGLVNLRGKTIPVLNLRRRLDMPDVEDSESARIVVVESESGGVGVVVDAVSEVVTLPPSAIEPPPFLVADTAGEVVCAVARLQSRLITLIDWDKILAA